MRAPSRLWIAYWPAALAVGALSVALVAASDHERRPELTIALGLLVGWSFVGSGLVVWARRPHNATGQLLAAVGFAWFLGFLTSADEPWLFSLGVALDVLFLAVFVHLLLAFPPGRLRGRLERLLVVATYGVALLAPLTIELFDASPVHGCDDCPRNAFLVSDRHGLARGLEIGWDVVAAGLAGAIVVLLVRRWQAATPAARRTLTPVLLSGGISIGLFGLVFALDNVSTEARDAAYYVAVAAFASVPFLFLLVLLRSRLARAGVARLLVEVPELPTPDETQEAMRRAVGDPTLRLAYWLPERDEYVGVDGERLELPSDSATCVTTRVESEAGPIAALVHDAALRDEPELLDEVVAAARLGLAKERILYALRSSERRTRALLDAIPDNMYRVARDGTYLDFSAHIPEDLVAPPDRIVGRKLPDLVPEPVASVLMNGIETALEEGAATVEYRIQRRRGLRDVESRIVPSGVDEVVIIVRDITERKAAEAELRALQGELQERLLELERERDFVRTVVDTAPTFFCLVDSDGAVVRFNSTLEAASGRLDDEEIRGHPFWEVFVAPEARDAVRADLERLVSEQAPLAAEAPLETPVGARVVVTWTGTPVRDERGTDRYLLCGVDVTQRRRDEEELRRLYAELEDRLRELGAERDFIDAVLETAPSLVCVFDREGRIVRFNRECQRVTGYRFEDVAGRRITEVFVPPDELEGVERALGEVWTRREPNEHENHWLTRDGERRLIAWANTILLDEHGEPSFGIGTGVDITERRRLQGELQRRLKELESSRARIVEAGMAERRRLERNLHDGAQQRLVSLSLALRLAQARLKSDPEEADRLLSGAAKELAHALEELRELARGIHPAILTDRGLEAALEALVGRTPVAVDLESELEERLPPAVEAAAFYVVSEALANVTKYAEASSVAVRIARRNGSAVVEVADDGRGGADPQRGSGLRGLADRVEALDGRLVVVSRPGEGTQIRAEIPCG